MSHYNCSEFLAKLVIRHTSATPEETEPASKANVRLVPLLYMPQEKVFGAAQAQAGIDQLKRLNISFDPVQEADLVLAVGPLLRDTANDLISRSKPVHMLIPGLAEIDPQNAPNTFVAFLSGRLSDDAARIKQGHLGIAAFARAQAEARYESRPDTLRRQPKLLLRGVDFEGQLADSSLSAQYDPETELKQFAEKYAQAVVNLHALPYTDDRQQLYSELSRASVALMPSWHEGFGLVAWEAIAAGVPLIVSEHSGVYRLLAWFKVR
jgi:glycosyltransferase involved in cell wall biosynthesis